MTKAQKDKLIKFTQDYYRGDLCKGDDLCIERYTDYRDEFPESEIKKIHSC